MGPDFSLGLFLLLFLALGGALGVWMWVRRRFRRLRWRWRRRRRLLQVALRWLRLVLPHPFLVLWGTIYLPFVMFTPDDAAAQTPVAGPVFQSEPTPTPWATLDVATPVPESGGGAPWDGWDETPTPDQWIEGVNCINVTPTPIYEFPPYTPVPYDFRTPVPTSCYVGDGSCFSPGVTPRPCCHDNDALATVPVETPEGTPQPTPEPTPWGVTASTVEHSGCALVECYTQPPSMCNIDSVEWCDWFGAVDWDGSRTVSGNTGAYCRSSVVNDQDIQDVFFGYLGNYADLNLSLSSVDSFTRECDFQSGGQQWIGEIVKSGGSDLCGGPGNGAQEELVVPFSGTGTCTVETQVTLVRNNPGCPPYNALCCNNANGKVYVRAQRVADGVHEAVHFTDNLTEPGVYNYGPSEIEGELYNAIVLSANWYGFTPGQVEGVTTVTCGGAVTTIEVDVNVVDVTAIHYLCVESANPAAPLEVWAGSDFTLDVRDYGAMYKPGSMTGWFTWPWNVDSYYYERLWSSVERQPLESPYADGFLLNPERCFEIVQEMVPSDSVNVRDWADYPDYITLGSGNVDKFPWSFLVCQDGTELLPGYPVPPGCLASDELPLCPESENPFDNIIEIIEGECYVFLPEFDFSVNLAVIGFGDVGIDTPGVQVCVDYLVTNFEFAGLNFGLIVSGFALAYLGSLLIKTFRDG